MLRNFIPKIHCCSSSSSHNILTTVPDTSEEQQNNQCGANNQRKEDLCMNFVQIPAILAPCIRVIMTPKTVKTSMQQTPIYQYHISETSRLSRSCIFRLSKDFSFFFSNVSLQHDDKKIQKNTENFTLNQIINFLFPLFLSRLSFLIDFFLSVASLQMFLFLLRLA